MIRITDWLRSESLPRNLYEMLGHPLLDPDRDALLQSIRNANRELLDYQSHPEKAISKRAMMLLTELGRCRGILEDEARHKVYVEEMAKTVREQFVAERGPLSLHVGNDLALWLATVHALPAESAERVAKLIRGAAPPPQPLPKRPTAKSGAIPAPAAEPVIEGVEIFELEDRPPPRSKFRTDPVDRASNRSKKPQRSMAVPVAIACGVLAISAIVAVVIVLGREKTEKVAKADPPAVQTPPSAPPPETPKPEEKKFEPAPPPKKPGFVPNPIEPDPTPPKKPEFLPKPVEPDPEPNPDPKPKPDPKSKVDPEPKVDPKPKPAEVPFDANEWSLPLDPKPAYQVKDVFLRIHSVEIRPLTDLDRKNDVSPPLLVILIEASNQGNAERRYRRLIDWQNINDDFYQYCHLFDDTKKNDQIKRPRAWLTYDRKRIEGIPNWVDDGDVNRVLAPKKQALLIPIIFENPKIPSRDFTLKINAIRILERRGSGEEYGWYHLQIRDKHWKK